MKVGILGGGQVAQKIAALAVGADHSVVVGQRTRAVASTGGWRVGSLAEAADYGDIVVIGIPFRVCAEVLAPLAGVLMRKVVVDTTNPHQEDWSPLLLGEENSAGEEIARLLPQSSVVKALNTVFAEIMIPEKLQRNGLTLTGFLCGDEAAARTTVAEFLRSLGFEPLDAGPMLCARYLEAMAHLNVQLAVRLAGGTDAGFLYHQGPRSAAELQASSAPSARSRSEHTLMRNIGSDGRGH